MISQDGFLVALRLLLLLFAAPVFFSCSGPDDSGRTDHQPAQYLLTPEEAASKAGYTEILGTLGGGFLALDPSKQKRLLYQTGSHYEMGFQMGYLASRGTAVMVHDYLDEFLFDMLDLPIQHEDLGPMWTLIRDLLIALTLPSALEVPHEFLQEMAGIAAGYGEAQRQGLPGTERKVTVADLLLLNQGMDVITSLTYNTLGRVGIACNQFACWGSRTPKGELLHGRDFQFYNAGVYQDEALVAIYVPTESPTLSGRTQNAAPGVDAGSLAGLPENGVDRDWGQADNGFGSANTSPEEPPGYPFATVTAPGFVGLTTGLNAQGISAGIDVVHCWPGRAGDPGLGGLLLVRKILEEASSLDEATDIIREADRGCPWIYLLADGKLPGAVTLETIQSNPPDPWMERLYQKNLRLARDLLGETVESVEPVNGVCVRPSDFVLEEHYRGKAFEVPGYSNSSKYPNDHTLLNISFPDPLEELPDLVAVTNHYLLPWMRLYQWAPLVWLVWQQYWPSSEWRYQTMVQILLEQTADGASFDWDAAWTVIDFLNPATENGAFFYGPEVDQAVAGHVCLMDDRNLVLRALYGHYNQPWVEVNLADFLP